MATDQTTPSREIFRRDNPETGVQAIYAKEGDSARWLGPTEFSQYYSTPTNPEGGTNSPVNDLGVRDDLYNKYFPQTPIKITSAKTPADTNVNQDVSGSDATKSEVANNEVGDTNDYYDTAKNDIESVNQSMENDLATYNTKLDEYAQTMDDRTKAIVANIQRSFALRKEQMADTNNRALQGKERVGIRSGRQRYANDLQTSILAEEERAGVQRLAELDAQEQMLIMEAQQASDDKQLALLDKKMSNVLQVQALKRQQVMDLYSISMQQENAAIARAQEERNAIKDEFAILSLQREQAIGDIELFAKGGYTAEDMTPGMIASYAEVIGVPAESVPSIINGIAQAEQASQMGDEITMQKNLAELLTMYPEGQQIDIGGKTYTSTGASSINADITTTKVSNDDGSENLVGIDKNTGKQLWSINTNPRTTEEDIERSAAENKSKTFYERMENADKIINEIGDEFTGLADVLLQAEIPFTDKDIVPEYLKSEDRKRFEQAKRNFVNAVLRQESGAAISPQEFESAEKQYFPVPGDSEAVIKQKSDNRKTVINGMAEAGKVNNTSANSGMTLEEYIGNNPDDIDLIEEIQSMLPNNATDNDIIKEIQNIRGFNNVGSDTNQATLKEVSAVDNGEKGGQCGRFVNKITGLGLGDSYSSKLAKMDETITQPEPGMVFVMPYKDTGHTGFIVNVNNDGTATVKDSNWSLDEKVKTHKIPLNKITGLAKV